MNDKLAVDAAPSHDHAHEQGAGSGHHHGHDHGPQSGRRLALAVGLTTLIFALELGGGLVAHSLALIGDGVHMLTDVLALGLAWFAVAQSARPPDARHPFGYERVGVLVALLNAASLLPLSAWIIWEAVGRLLDPEPVDSALMFWIALVGLVANAVMGLTLHGAAQHSVNVRSAFLHVLGDAAAAGGVVIGAVIIHETSWDQVDSLLSLGIAALVGWSGWRMTRETANVLLDAVPPQLAVETVVARMLAVRGVRAIYSLRLWQVTPGRVALQCHVLVPDQSLSRTQLILGQLRQILDEEFHIHEATIEAECATDHPKLGERVLLADGSPSVYTPTTVAAWQQRRAAAGTAAPGPAVSAPAARRQRQIGRVLGGGLALVALGGVLWWGADLVKLVSHDLDVQTFASQGAQVVTERALHPLYNSNPPTSGWHRIEYPPRRVVRTPVDDELAVNILSLDNVYLFYDCFSSSAECTELRTQLEQLVNAGPIPRRNDGVYLAPRNLPRGHKIALTAWQHLQFLDHFDKPTIMAFLQTYIDAQQRGTPTP